MVRSLTLGFLGRNRSVSVTVTVAPVRKLNPKVWVWESQGSAEPENPGSCRGGTAETASAAISVAIYGAILRSAAVLSLFDVLLGLDEVLDVVGVRGVEVDLVEVNLVQDGLQDGIENGFFLTGYVQIKLVTTLR